MFFEATGTICMVAGVDCAVFGMGICMADMVGIFYLTVLPFPISYTVFDPLFGS